MQITPTKLLSQQRQGSYHMKPYSDRFLARFNHLLERVILNNRDLTVLEVKNVGNAMTLQMGRQFYAEYQR